MDDRVRYTSMPPRSAPDAGSTLVNPSYSSTIISTASETASVTILIFLVGFVSILMLLNFVLIAMWASSSNLTSSNHQIKKIVDQNETNIELELVLPSSIGVPTTISEISTLLAPVPSVPDVSVLYQRYTESFNRTKSDTGLSNFEENFEYFGKQDNLAPNHFADLSLKDFKKIVNSRRDSSHLLFSKQCVNSQMLKTVIFAKNLHDNSRIRARVDLRRSARMPKVQNQGTRTTCNSGYAYAAIGQVDYIHRKSFSVQYLLCDMYNLHCQGGEVMKAMETLFETGAPEDTELPYSESMKWCDISGNFTKSYNSPPCVASAFTYNHTEQTVSLFSILHLLFILFQRNCFWKAREVTTDEFISIIIATYSPAIVEVPVDRSFFFYNKGFYKPNCDEIIGYQPVLVVGHDKRDGREFWILRNSFGTEWGIEGYFEMEKGIKATSKECDAFAYAFY